MKLEEARKLATPSSECVPEQVALDGEFTADQLEAIAWWMRHAGKGT